MTAVFKAHPKTATAEAQIERQKMEARDVFIEKKKALEDVLKDHQSVTQKLVASGSNSSVADKELARTLLDEATKLEKEIATLRTTQANDLKNSFVKERRQILDEISTAIVKFNAEGKYAVILDSSAQSTNGIPQVIHAPGAVEYHASHYRVGEILQISEQRHLACRSPRGTLAIGSPGPSSWRPAPRSISHKHVGANSDCSGTTRW